MDLRDFSFWGRKAQKFLLQNQLKLLLASRAAFSESKDFNSMRGELEQRIRELEIGKEAVIQEAWDSFKKER